MATWEQFETWIRSTYAIEPWGEPGGGLMGMQFKIGPRSQLVFVSLMVDEMNGSEWAHIDSPIARVGSVDLELLGRMVVTCICGGLVINGKLVCLRHAVQLATLSADDFTVPLNNVLLAVDGLELQVTRGSDEF